MGTVLLGSLECMWMAMQAAHGLSQRSEHNNEAWPCDQYPIPDLPHQIPQGQSPGLHLIILLVEGIASVRAGSVFPWDPGRVAHAIRPCKGRARAPRLAPVTKRTSPALPKPFWTYAKTGSDSEAHQSGPPAKSSELPCWSHRNHIVRQATSGSRRGSGQMQESESHSCI